MFKNAVEITREDIAVLTEKLHKLMRYAAEQGHRDDYEDMAAAIKNTLRHYGVAKEKSIKWNNKKKGGARWKR